MFLTSVMTMPWFFHGNTISFYFYYGNAMCFGYDTMFLTIYHNNAFFLHCDNTMFLSLFVLWQYHVFEHLTWKCHACIFEPWQLHNVFLYYVLPWQYPVIDIHHDNSLLFFGNGNTLFLTWYHVLFMSYSVSFLRSEQSYQSKLIVCYLSYFPLCCQFPGVVPFGFPRCQISYLMGSLPDSVSFIIQHNGFYCHRSHKAPGRLVFHSYQWAVAFLAWVCCGM